MTKRLILLLGFSILLTYSTLLSGMGSHNEEDSTMTTHTETATFAGGCFWCMQPPYDDLKGVISTTVGYTGGHVKNPTYEAVSTGATGHTEAVQIVFDPTLISYEKLLDTFWRNINPTQYNQQFADVGSQYRTGIFYHSEIQRIKALDSRKKLIDSRKFSEPIATEIVSFSEFYPAESYHQEFYKNNPLRYNLYKKGSGRERYINETWK